MKKILIIGIPAELQVGGYEVQLGNAAIFIPMAAGLQAHIPDAEISTTVQLSEAFRRKCPVHIAAYHRPVRRYRAVVQMFGSLLNMARSRLRRLIKKALRVDLAFLVRGEKMRAFAESDVVLDFNGDIFPTDIHNPARALRHVFDIRTIRNLGVPVVEFASSPGPFKTWFHRLISRAAYGRMSAIVNRESVSNELLGELGIGKTPVIDTACPAFLLEPAPAERGRAILAAEGIDVSRRPLIGLSVCGYNFPGRSWRVRDPDALRQWVPALRYLLDDLGATVFFVPHANYENPYISIVEPVHGYDYEISVNLCKLAGESYGDRLRVIERIYTTEETKSVIGQCDFYVSGRMHAGVAALSQGVPTVLVAYGHKHRGIARLVGQEENVFRGGSAEDLRALVQEAWERREASAAQIRQNLPKVKQRCGLAFDIVRDVAGLDKAADGRVPEDLVNEWRQRRAKM